MMRTMFRWGAKLLNALQLYRYHVRIKGLVARGLTLGKNVVIEYTANIDDNYPYLIRIGDNCAISNHVRVLAHDATTFRSTGGYTRLGKVELKENCFIGERTIILPGVTIGPNVLVAAGSVVNRDIPPNSCAAGVPARVYAKFDALIERHRGQILERPVFDFADLAGNPDPQLETKVRQAVQDGAAYVKGSPGRYPYMLNVEDQPVAEDKVEQASEQVNGVPFVTVIVPMYNEKDSIAKCLGSLVEQDYPSDRFEVLVVDGRSDDGSRELALGWARNQSLIRVLDNPKRITAAGLNVGVRNAKGQIIILLSAHSWASGDFVSQNVLHLSGTDAACVGGPLQTNPQSTLDKAIALAMSSPFGVGNALFRYSNKEQYVDTVAFAAYHRHVFDEIGLFDEELVYNEDDEFNYRLRAHGGQILLTPEIKSCYCARTSLSGVWQQYYRYGLGKIRVIKRHPKTSSMRPFVPFALVVALLVTGVSSVLYPLFLPVFLCVLSSYLAASLLVSIYICAKHGWRYLPLLPVAFACLHFAYGFGFTVGVLKLATRSQRRLFRAAWRKRSST